ncbi:DUF7576 family protein [Haloarchaeobius sp. DFWS5]|uniref:DUF7576 family protein n=1 Tax=Haloarchaeobius sp. DFWS5 TaxID=3446114 RepID=UPI003EB7639C
MALSEYVGRATPAGNQKIIHVAPHSHWRPGKERTEPCAHCGENIVLSKRHVLVEVEDSETGETQRQYVKNETCLSEWFGE